ncbi:MAG TPA: MDR family MFS transporter [Polyangiaceae bacterium]|nr:MDR family MFS transporter [Polyangiaceae bacterium]
MDVLSARAAAMSAPEARARRLTLVAILLSTFLAAMEATVVATAMPSVVADLHGLSLYGWVGAVYMLSSTLTMPLYGKLADLYGRKPVLLSALGVFVLGSVASGLAPTMGALVAFRAVQGVGAGGIQPIALTIIGDLYRPEERGRVQGLFGAVWALAGTSGPLLGGLLARALSWRWVFFANVPFALLAGGLLSQVFRERVTPKKVSFDLLGSALLAGAVVLVLAGASRVRPLVTLPLGALLTALFLAAERRAEDPVLPPKLLGLPVIRASNASSAVLGALVSGTVTYLPLYEQAVLGASPTEAGMALAPMLVSWPIASTLAGRALPRVGYRPLIRAGALVSAVSAGLLLAALHARLGLAALGACVALLGVGMGATSVAAMIAVQETAAWSERGVATASNMFSRTIGGALAVGGMGAIVAGAVGAHASPELLNELLGPERGKGLAPAVIATLSGDLAAGAGQAFAVLVGLAVVGALVGLAFPRMPPPTRAPEGGAEESGGP